MGRFLVSACVGIIALTLAGCGSGGDDNAVTQPINPPQQPAPKPFEKPPVVAQNPKEIVIANNSLIRPTVVNERLKNVKTGRQDPFAALFVPEAPKVATAPKPVPRMPKLPTVTAPQPVAKPSNPEPQISSVPPPPLPTVVAAPPEQVVPTQPDLANAVGVVGIVQIGDTTQAIVQVPNEATSRYVAEGQRLSNGQVLVKRIEVNAGSEPVVILEQNGIEVAKAVGEEASQQGKTATVPGTNDGNSAAAFRQATPTSSNITGVVQPASNNNTDSSTTLTNQQQITNPAVTQPLNEEDEEDD